MRARGFEPLLVRVPSLPDDRLATEHVLGMEFIPGVSLAAAIEAEQNDLAEALGIEGGAPALRKAMMARIHSHFWRGNEAEGELCAWMRVART